MESWNLRAGRDISWRNWGSGWGSGLPGTTQPGRGKARTGAQMYATPLHLVILCFSEATCLSFSKLLHFQASCPRRVSCFTSKAISSTQAPAKHLALDRDVPCFPLSAGCWRGGSWIRPWFHPAKESVNKQKRGKHVCRWVASVMYPFLCSYLQGSPGSPSLWMPQALLLPLLGAPWDPATLCALHFYPSKPPLHLLRYGTACLTTCCVLSCATFSFLLCPFLGILSPDL